MAESTGRRFTRRKLLGRAIALGGGACLAGGLYAWRVEPHWLQVTEHPMPLAGLPGAWLGRTIVHVTDLHAGPVVDRDYLRRAIRRVNGLNGDLVVVTGDLMTYDGPARIDEAANLLGELDAPPLGTLVVLGNHDYGRGYRDARVADRMADAVRAAGATVLRNEAIEIDGLPFVGVDEVWAGRCDVAGALAGYDTARTGVALIHNPDIVELPGWSGFRGWLLAGHTHGGQVDPPLFAPPMLPVRRRDRYAGRYDLGDERTLYINRGVGYLRRVRFGCRPEIARFTLTG